MKTLGVIRKNTYFDSVTLMGISKRLHDLPGVASVSVSMGTDMNKEVLETGGFDLAFVKDAGPNDLMIVCTYDDRYDREQILSLVEEMFTKQNQPQEHSVERPKTLASASSRNSANVAVISLPGIYAAAEARKALNLGLHVMMFSDNVSVEDEVSLKNLAHEKGLLMMGPDCGTSIIQGVALCFANKVNRGSVGIVSASGTGSQELTVLLDEASVGISQLIGTGGRDLSEEVGGIMFLDAFDALEHDPATSHILLVSKPPHESVMRKVQDKINHSTKPVVACFLGEKSLADSETVSYAASLEDAARAMIRLVMPNAETIPASLPTVDAMPSGRYLRGLFCGGTLMEEAKQLFLEITPSAPLYSNSSKGGAKLLENARKSQENTLLDMGDDQFTRGKPHPMIDPEARNNRIESEAADPETAVILLDFVLGFGSHEDPVGAALPAIREAKRIAAEDGRRITFIGYVLGTNKDPQNKEQQKAQLAQEGVYVCASNTQAATLAASIVKELM